MSVSGFKLVDPDGLMAEPEYDLGIIMREDPTELMVGGPLGPSGAASPPSPGTGRRPRSGNGGRGAGLDRAPRRGRSAVQPVAGQMLHAAEGVAALA